MSSDTVPATPALAVEGLVAGYGGVVALNGVSISAGTAAITHVPEGQGVIPELTVEENLRVGMMSWPRGRPRAQRAAALDEAYGRFPPLAVRRRKLAASLSGGERQ